MPFLDGLKSNRPQEEEIDYENFEWPKLNLKGIDLKKFNNGARKPLNFFKRMRLSLKLNYSFKTLVVIIFLGALFVFSMSRGVMAKAEIKKLTDGSKQNLASAFECIEKNDISCAVKESQEAGVKIEKLKYIAQSWGQDISYLRLVSANDSKLTANERLLDASYLIINTFSDINNKLADSSLFDIKSDDDNPSKISFDFSNLRRIIFAQIELSLKNLDKGKDEIILVKKNLDKDSLKEINVSLNAIDKATKSLESLRTVIDGDLSWLTNENNKEKRNILILFQNNSELRGGSGGSLGSFGVAKFSEGKLEGIDFGTNIYKLDKAFREKEKVEVPDQLNLLIPSQVGLSMKDSGWDIDGPESMKKIMSFYEKETGEKTDGVVMVDVSAFGRLLHFTGPITVNEFQKTINEENYKNELEEEVHNGYFEREGGKVENEPKKILALMMPKFINLLISNLADKEKSADVLSAMNKLLKEKHITMYYKEAGFQKRIEDLNFSGKVNSSLGDYLYINNSNLDGAKSSSSVAEKVRLSSTIEAGGTVKNNLLLTRTHNGEDRFPDGLNKNFIRLLLPENSKVKDFVPREGYFEQMFDRGLKDGRYFWMDKNAGKETVNFWMSTKPRETSSTEISYEPNYSVNTQSDFTYVLNLQKQPGALPDAIELELNYPDTHTPQNVSNYDKKNNKIILKFVLDQDKTVKIKFKKN